MKHCVNPFLCENLGTKYFRMRSLRVEMKFDEVDRNVGIAEGERKRRERVKESQ